MIEIFRNQPSIDTKPQRQYRARRFAFAIACAMLSANMIIGEVGAEGSASVEPNGVELPDNLRAIENRLKQYQDQHHALTQQADALRGELEALQTKIAALDKNATAPQRQAGQVTSRLGQLAEEEVHLLQQLDMQQDRINNLVLDAYRAKQRHSLADQLYRSSQDPLAWARGSRLLLLLISQFQEQTKQTRQTLAEVTATRLQIEENRHVRETSVANLQEQRAELQAQLRAKQVAKADIDTVRRRKAEEIAELTQRAEDLRSLLAGLRALDAKEEARKAAEAERRRQIAQAKERRLAAEAAKQRLLERSTANSPRSPFAASPVTEGSLGDEPFDVVVLDRSEQTRKDKPAEAKPEKLAQIALLPSPDIVRRPDKRFSFTGPVRGDVIKPFGTRDRFGLRTEGIIYLTHAGAEVIATEDSRVMFAGHFRDYGQMLILAFGQDYHMVLAGMAEIHAQVGQSISAGDLVGRMDVDDESRLRLYVELRNDGTPINPLPWMTARYGKASG